MLTIAPLWHRHVKSTVKYKEGLPCLISGQHADIRHEHRVQAEYCENRPPKECMRTRHDGIREMDATKRNESKTHSNDCALLVECFSLLWSSFDVTSRTEVKFFGKGLERVTPREEEQVPDEHGKTDERVRLIEKSGILLEFVALLRQDPRRDICTIIRNCLLTNGSLSLRILRHFRGLLVTLLDAGFWLHVSIQIKVTKSDSC